MRLSHLLPELSLLARWERKAGQAVPHLWEPQNPSKSTRAVQL